MTLDTPPAFHVAVDLLPDAALAAGSVAVVVDVLRMTTTATVLADLGLEQLCVVADLDRARERARRDRALLLGERDARPPEGFDAGNSPAELTAALARGRAAVMCTTNGSAAVEACAPAEAVLLGCIRNGAAVARRSLALARQGNASGDVPGDARGVRRDGATGQACGRVRVVFAGTDGRLSLDDIAGAGHIVSALAALAPDAELDDAALTARAVASEPDLARLLGSARHGRRLLAAGFQKDVLLAARRDVSTAVVERVPGSRDVFRPRHPG